MSQSKVERFNPDTAKLAEFFKALSHPARLEILSVLSVRGTCICGDFVGEIPLAQSTVSQHLKVLKEVGLIRGEIDGPSVCYCLDYGTYLRLRAMIEQYFANILPEDQIPYDEPDFH